MKHVVSIVGRPNVGKSTLFNRLTCSRDALTADVPGLTRDVLTGNGVIDNIPYLVMDTAGISGGKEDHTTEAAIKNSLLAISGADRLLWVVDAKTGLNANDIAIAERLRKQRNLVTVAINKSEGVDTMELAAECIKLGYKNVHAISALRGHGLEDMMRTSLEGIAYTNEEESEKNEIKVAIVGRQNAGKSTLVNCLLGEDRMLTGVTPGITRDSVRVSLQRGRRWQLVDTAGIRHRSKVKDKIEALSMAKSLRSIAESDITMLLLDAMEGVTRQDMQLLDMILQQGKRYIVVMNKNDLLPAADRKRVKSDFAHKLRYLPNIKIYGISALQRTYIRPLLQGLERVVKSYDEGISTSRLNNILQRAIQQHPPPIHNGRRPRLLYAHLNSTRPMRIAVHGRQVETLRTSWRRYLIRFYTNELKLEGTPLQLLLQNQENPYHRK